VEVPGAEPVYEIPNPFAFKGATFILKRWADRTAKDIDDISIPAPPRVSMSEVFKKWRGLEAAEDGKIKKLLSDLPAPILHAAAQASTDPADLVHLAEIACGFTYAEKPGQPVGLLYERKPDGTPKAVIYDPHLFEMVANNPCLPDAYKEVMVLRPGVQGASEIVGEITDDGGRTHVFEYLRRNSYIPGGHYAANNAHDAVRYRIRDLSVKDMQAMRHFYYQRTFVRLAGEMGMSVDCERRPMSGWEIEALRRHINDVLPERIRAGRLFSNRTLWGWNFGFDYAASGYRLLASHQQVHQQYAMVPSAIEGMGAEEPRTTPFACGSLIADFIADYYEKTGTRFFEAYIQAIRANERMDETDGEKSLVIYSDENVMLFVPKAQTSQWELQIMTLPPVGNILEADPAVRDSIDYAMLAAMRILEEMGARMIVTIEYAKAIDEAEETGQRLIYAFLPRLPESPGGFSETQLRWINGHYPEDFASACRRTLEQIHPMIK
jgi:hypothetical protein